MTAEPKDQPDCPQISVVIPFQDVRARPDHLATWTRQQTLSPDRFEVIVITNRRDPKCLQQIRDLLRPGDRLIQADETGPFPLYAIGAKAARGSLLFFSEDHCLADAGCLSAVERYFAANDCTAATVRWGHVNYTAVARMEQLVNEIDVRTWSDPGHWNQVRIRGFAIVRDVFFRFGGFESRYGAFSEAILAARLHEAGIRIGFVHEAGVRHVNSWTLGEIHGNARGYSLRECAYCDDHDPVFCERYFHSSTVLLKDTHVPADVARWLTWAAWRVAWREVAARRATRRDLAGLAGSLLRSASRAVCGGWGPRALANLALWTTRARFAWWWFHEPRRLAAFHDFWRTCVRCARLEYLAQRRDDSISGSPLSPDSFEIDLARLNGWGWFAPERHAGRHFRWAGPLAVLLVDLPAGDYTLTLDTCGFRGPADTFPLGVFWNQHLIEAEKVERRNEIIRVRLERALFRPGIGQRLTLVTAPLPASGADPRRLGLPVGAIRFEEMEAGSCRLCA